MKSAHRNQVDWDAYAIVLPMIVWGASFFFPTLINRPEDWFFPGVSPGFLAPVASFFMMVMTIAIISHEGARGVSRPEEALLYFSISSLWLANLWMILAPAMIKRLRKGKGQFFLLTTWIWTLVPIPIAIKVSKNNSAIEGTRITTGFYVWWASFIFMALICTAYMLHYRPNRLEPYPPPHQ